MRQIPTRVLFPFVALAVWFLRHAYPKWFDLVDLVLLGVFLLPWLPMLVRRLEFPGGRVDFAEVRGAADKVTKGSQRRPDRESAKVLPELVYDDANLALVALRIELERRLRQLAAQHSINADQSLRRLFRQLQKQQVLADPILSGLDELIMFGNQAAHGADVDPRAVSWAQDVGPRVIAVLDQYLDESG